MFGDNAPEVHAFSGSNQVGIANALKRNYVCALFNSSILDDRVTQCSSMSFILHPALQKRGALSAASPVPLPGMLIDGESDASKIRMPQATVPPLPPVSLKLRSFPASSYAPFSRVA